MIHDGNNYLVDDDCRGNMASSRCFDTDRFVSEAENELIKDQTITVTTGDLRDNNADAQVALFIS